MARLKLREVILDRSGNALSGVSVYLYNQDTTTPISATLYADKTGGTTKSNPLTSDANGAVEAYADAGAVDRVDLYCSPAGLGPITLSDRSFELDTADVVTLTRTQTLTNKTLTSPVINTPTGDVVTPTGTQTLTNKTLSVPVLIGRQYRGPKTWTTGCLGQVAVGADATSQIQAVIDEAKLAQSVSGNEESGVEIIFDAAEYYSVSQIKLNGLLRSRLIGGGGSSGTKLVANRQSTARPVVEMVGTRSVNVEGVTVAATNGHLSGSAPSTSPQAAFLMTATTSGADSTQNKLIDCGSWGHFSKAALAIYGSTDNIIRDSSFVNYIAGNYGIFVGNSNVLSLSASVSIIATDTTGSGDQKFSQVQAHLQPESGGLSPSTSAGASLYIYGSLAVEWGGGNLGSYSRAALQIGGGARNLVFIRPQMYTDSATNKPLYVVYLEANAAPKGLVFISPHLNSIPIASGSPAIFALGDEATIEDIWWVAPRFESAPGTPPLFRVVGTYASGGTNAINGGWIDAKALDLNMNPSGQGPSIGARTTIVAPGTITMDTGTTDSSKKITDSGMTIPGTTTMGTASAGTVSSSGGVTGGTGVTATTGDVTATAGDIKGRHIVGNTSTPSVSVSSGWGTGGSAPTVTVTGTDMGLFIRVATAAGGAGLASGPTITITFANAYASTPAFILQLTGSDDASAWGKPITLTGRTTSAITVQFQYTPLASKVYDFDMVSVGR